MNLGYNTHTHGNVIRKLPVQLSLKKNCHLLFFYKIREEEGRTGPALREWYQLDGGGEGKGVGG
jgi:hypothetical protein